ncbi:MAG: peptidylprolyl isomerase [Sphingobacteriales bacterium]|nr:peptidylprolyl isomerase [Sphingobacteriales bacterium]MBI3720294.1 peptidylprolyl isomerase [Sphingobacteriales bacterium]
MKATKGSKVKVHYTGRLADGEQFDSSAGREPLEFEVGAGMMIKGFDDAVVGMTVGDKKTITIPPHEGYGESNPEMIVEFPRDRFPADLVPEVGMQLNMSNGAGQNFPVTITVVQETTVTLDANHFLAGKDLIFDIEMVEVSGGSPLIIVP